MISLSKPISIDVNATGDQEFDRRTGLDLLTATARLWHSLGHHDATGSSASTGLPDRMITGPSRTTTCTRT
jgi:alpha,alpha-trehalose phosphorylase